MKLYDKIIRQCRIDNERNQDIFDSLKNTKVFDLTNVSQIVGDWKEEKNHLIPKRPPFDFMWAEWDDERKFKEGLMVYRCGVILMKITRTLMEGWIRENVAIENRDMFLEKMIGNGWDEWYVSQGFLDIKQSNTESRGIRSDVNVVFYCMRNDSREAEAYAIDMPEEELLHSLQKGYNTLGFAPFGTYADGLVQSCISASVVLMACSLLHCRNITTETVHVDAKLQKATIKRGYPKLCDYHVIKLKLNEHKVVGVNDEKGSRETKMHMVRGHFKNLQDARYREKGWHWWPAHVRGNPELGSVVADYEMKR